MILIRLTTKWEKRRALFYVIVGFFCLFFNKGTDFKKKKKDVHLKTIPMAGSVRD